MSDPDIQEQEGKDDGERQRTGPAGVTGRGAEPGERGGDSEAELETEEEDTGKPKENLQRRHVPGGVLLSQVRVYLVVKVLPGWMRVDKGEGKRSEEQGRRQAEEELN
ncbi:hypothetical protein NDU88_011533 [Pleurodeles waltl]|uniref:Uncharacterized protein n=1 Tax=Pleurodeles waltl TaxID=8319 RepID=A0AAV7S557_PLEWA|nr:hypothetical protein NDU88_011533 [Pleurodeles waltl]